MLRVEGLDVRYGGVRAVQEIDLQVRRGELVVLLGPNGAGKTSTMEAIAGVIRPSSGRITWDDEDLTGRPPEYVVSHGIALVPEGRRILASLTVRENLLLARASRRGKAQFEADLHDTLERFPALQRMLSRTAGLLSGGEQQQLAVARALLCRPQLLLLDEPSLGLAPQVIDTLFERIADLAADGLTILMVEQNAKRALAMADRAYVMAKGRCQELADRNPADDELAAAYMGAGG